MIILLLLLLIIIIIMIIVMLLPPVRAGQHLLQELHVLGVGLSRLHRCCYHILVVVVVVVVVVVMILYNDIYVYYISNNICIQCKVALKILYVITIVTSIGGFFLGLTKALATFKSGASGQTQHV